MEDSDKGDSSTKEAKASLLDDDFSKDFLSSWKSMSATGGDDMDFNFEPVNKGKKKTFDFVMDMDFSLDDTFGKMLSSFKIDMPDLDFSSSPKKPSKSKENSEEHSAKGNHTDKHDNYAFSFDFNGLDDFNLDAPSTKRDKSPSSEKKNKNDDSELEDFSIQVTIDKKETAEVSIRKGPEVCEDVAFSKTEDLAVGDISSVNCALKSTAISCPVQETDLDKNQISSDKKLADNNIHKTDHQNHNKGEASSNKSCSPGREGILDPISPDKPPQSKGSLMAVESTEVHMSTETENTMTSLSTEDEIQLKEEKCSTQSHTQLKEMNLPINTPLVKASVQANDSERSEIRSPERKLNNGSSEGGIIAEELPAAVDSEPATEKPTSDKSPLECSTDKMNINYGNNDLGNSGNMGRAKLILGTVDPYATRDTKALSTSARSSAEMQNPVLKVSSTPIGSGTNAAKAMLMRNNVRGAMNSKFTVTQATKDGGRKELSAYEHNKESSTSICTADRSISVSCNNSGNSKHHEKKSDDNSSSCTKEKNSNSCTKESSKRDSVLEKTEKIAAAHSPSRDQEGILIGKDRSEMNVNTVLLNGKEARNRLSSLEYEKMNNIVKSSGFKNPTRTAPEEGIQSDNQGQGKYKDKISSMSSIKKLKIVQGNKLSSQRTENKMLALPTLKLASATTDKQLTTPAKQRNFGSLGNFEKSTRLQAAIKMVSPVSAEKQTLPTYSLKRKPSVDVDTGPVKLPSPKRASPNESRISKASPKKHENRDQTKGNFLEGSRKNVSVEYISPKFDFDQEANIEALQFSMMVENEENVEKAEACAKELDNICNMLKQKHEEAKELLVRALVNNNYLLMLNHPIYEEKIHAVLRLASRLTTKELEVEA